MIRLAIGLAVAAAGVLAGVSLGRVVGDMLKVLFRDFDDEEYGRWP